MPIAAGNFRYYVCAHGAERDAVFDRSIRAESYYVYGALHYAEKLPFADPMPMWAPISPHYSGIQKPVSWISQFGVKIKVRSSARRGRSAGLEVCNHFFGYYPHVTPVVRCLGDKIYGGYWNANEPHAAELTVVSSAVPPHRTLIDVSAQYLRQ